MDMGINLLYVYFRWHQGPRQECAVSDPAAGGHLQPAGEQLHPDQTPVHRGAARLPRLH